MGGPRRCHVVAGCSLPLPGPLTSINHESAAAACEAVPRVPAALPASLLPTSFPSTCPFPLGFLPLHHILPPPGFYTILLLLPSALPCCLPSPTMSKASLSMACANNQRREGGRASFHHHRCVIANWLPRTSAGGKGQTGGADLERCRLEGMELTQQGVLWQQSGGSQGDGLGQEPCPPVNLQRLPVAKIRGEG